MNRHRTYTIVLLAAAIACSGENNPLSPLKAPTSITADYTAPPVSLTYSTPYAQAVPIVRGYESDARSMDAEVGVAAGSQTAVVAPVGFSAASLAGSQTKVGGGVLQPVTPMYLPAGCTKEYIECVYDCIYTRLQFNDANGEFWQADDEYWENVLTGRDYLNHLNGGPQTRMYNNLNLMARFARQWRSIGCRNFV